MIGNSEFHELKNDKQIMYLQQE